MSMNQLQKEPSSLDSAMKNSNLEMVVEEPADHQLLSV